MPILICAFDCFGLPSAAAAARTAAERSKRERAEREADESTARRDPARPIVVQIQPDGSNQPLAGAEGVASSTPEFWEANGSQRAESTALQPSVVADSAAVEMDAEAQLLQAACRPVPLLASPCARTIRRQPF